MDLDRWRDHRIVYNGPGEAPNHYVAPQRDRQSDEPPARGRVLHGASL